MFTGGRNAWKEERRGPACSEKGEKCLLFLLLLHELMPQDKVPAALQGGAVLLTPQQPGVL